MGSISRSGFAVVGATLLAGAVVSACVAAPGEGDDAANADLSTCSFAVTQNVYDGPNYWGTITIKNTALSGVTGFAVKFTIPSGDHCTNDAVPSGAVLSPLTGSGPSAHTTANVCTFTWSNASLGAGASLTFNYSTDGTNFSTASGVTVTSSSCSSGADAGGADAGHDSGAADAGHDTGATDASSADADAGKTTDASADVTASTCGKYLTGSGPASQWVYVDSTGKLAYKPLNSKGDRILDFSYAGYMGGGVPLPAVPVKQTVNPSGGDDTSAIASAIAAVSKLPLTNGVRGAVLLKPGTFTMSGGLTISASGVVLRGSGSGSGGTVVNVTGSPRDLLHISGSGGETIDSSSTTAITDAYVPSGSRSFSVASTSGYAVGQSVLVQRPVTSAWVHFMGMDTFTGATWLAPGATTSWERTIAAISGNTITLDAPLTDSLDAATIKPPGATISKYTFSGRISQVGLESIRFVIGQPRSATTNSFFFLRIDAVEDGWIKDVEAHNFPDGVWLESGDRRFTIEDTRMTHDATTYYTSEAPFDFFVRASEVLVDRSSSTGGNKIWYLATQNQETGPNVALNFTGTGTNSHVTAHQRWGTGFLVDGASVAGGTFLGNNGTLGKAEGWSMGWGVVWNSVSDVRVEQPPGAMNWAIGCTGAELTGISPPGIYESQNKPVAMKSLYLAQLCERLGPQATANLGY